MNNSAMSINQKTINLNHRVPLFLWADNVDYFNEFEVLLYLYLIASLERRQIILKINKFMTIINKQFYYSRLKSLSVLITSQ